MGVPPEVKLNITTVQEAKELGESSAAAPIISQSTDAQTENNYKRWLRVAVHAVLVLSGQSVAILLQRYYFVKGGNSKWMATLGQLGGFPILIPYYFFINLKNPGIDHQNILEKPPSLILVAVYISLGLLVSGNCYLFSIGLQYLPASTYSVLVASQLAFNAVFSFFLNSQRFTPVIINSLILLTISSVLLAVNNEASGSAGVSKAKYAVGCICTVAGSAVSGLVLSLTQLVFRKVLKTQTFKAVMNMIICMEAVATAGILVGLFASGEWRGLTREMDEYQLGKVAYLMMLFWAFVAWQACAVGNISLIFEVSSLFSNAISVLGLPIVPALSVFFFHDEMDGIKAISLVLAIWGFISFAYQHYLDERESKAETRNDEAHQYRRIR